MECVFKYVFMKNILCLFILSLFATVACKDQKRTHNLKPLSESAVVYIDDEKKESMEKFASELVESVNDGDGSLMEDRLNVQAMYDIALRGLDLEKKELSQLNRAFSEKLSETKKTLLGVLCSGKLSWIRVVARARPALLYRVDMLDGTFTYVELHLKKRESDAQWEIVDLHFFSNGKPNSGLIRDLAAKSLPKYGKPDPVMEDALIQLPSIMAKLANKDNDGAWAEWQKLGSKAKENRAILGVGYQIAFQGYFTDMSNLKWKDALREVMGGMQKNFPDDPGIAMMQLSVHEINEEWSKYREAVGKIRNAVGGDHDFLDVLELTADLGEKKFKKVIKVAKNYLDKHPNDLDVGAILWYGYAGSGDFTELTDSLRKFSESYELIPEALQEDELLKPYLESTEGKAFIKSLQK